MEGREPHALTRRDAAVAGLLGLAAAAAVLATMRPYGMAWDEAYYYPTYRDVAEWVRLLFSSPRMALSPEGIALGWMRIDELPPVTKWLGALTVSLPPFLGELATMRLFAVALFGAAAALAYIAARRIATMPFALLAAGLYAMHPRVFGHGHFAASETVFAFATILAILACGGDTARWRTRLLVAACCGLAIATKVNGLILTAAIVAWLACLPLLGPKEDRRRAFHDSAWTAAAIAVVGLALAYAVWPLFWREPITRAIAYYEFIRDHFHQGLWYMGAKWNQPVTPGGEAPLAPMHYPFVMLLVASPPAFLVLALGGAMLAAWRVVAERGEGARMDLLLLLLAIAPLAAASLPNAPKYDGARLFFPAFLPLALLAARLDAFAGDDEHPPWWRRTRIALPAAGLALAFASLLPAWGSGIRYFNEVVRLAAPRGEDFPFEVSYWMEAVTPEVMEEIVALHGGGPVRLRTLALHEAAFHIQREWGRFPAEVIVNGPPPYDFHLLQNRRGFWMRSEWAIHLEREPLTAWPPGAREPALFLHSGEPPNPAMMEAVGRSFATP